MLPNFIIIGSMKCGTTSLAYYLSQHPEVFISNPDKIDFFSKDHLYEKGLDWYESFFNDTENAIAIGEGTDNYTNSYENRCERSAQRISENLPACKLIYITKHPIKQIESAWMHRYAGKRETRSFNDAVLHSPFNYLETANYKKQLKHYYDRFPPDQIKVFFTEDLASNRQEFVRSCLSFLGVDPEIEYIDFNPQNISSGKLLDKPFTKMLRHFPFMDHLGKNLPPSIKRRMEKIFTYQMNERPVWEKETLDHVLNHLWDDTRDFLEQHGKPRDFWDLERSGR